MWKVLICDDEAMTRRGLTRMIGHCRKDMEVVGAAAQGEEACAMIEQLRPSIVFMDINMPLVSGLEVIERYHEDPRLRFVIISGYSDFEYAQKACRYHVVDYLLKPVTEEQLSAVLDRCAAMLQQEITTSRIVVPQHQDRRMIKVFGSCTLVSVKDRPIDIIISNTSQPIIVNPQLRHLGIEWTDYDVTVVKQGYIFPDFKAQAQFYVMSLTDGATPQDTASIPFKRIMRPMFPIDQI